MEQSKQRHILVATAFAAVSILAPLLQADDLGYHEGIVTAQEIDDYLAKKQYHGKQSPLKGEGQAFMASGQSFDIDPRLIVAISGIETFFGIRTCTKDNAWNWFWQGPCPKSPFDSFESGINTVSKYLRRNYINKGYNTVALIQKKYCTAPVKNGVVCPGWITNVNLFRNQLAGLAPATLPAPTTSADTGRSVWIYVVVAALVLCTVMAAWILVRRRRLA